MEYDFWTMRESPFHQLSDSQCIFLFAFGEVKIICAFVTFSADPMLVIIVLLAVWSFYVSLIKKHSIEEN